jgi:hypothetical protein
VLPVNDKLFRDDRYEDVSLPLGQPASTRVCGTISPSGKKLMASDTLEMFLERVKTRTISLAAS